MQVQLSAHAAELLRKALAERGELPTEILENALAQYLHGEGTLGVSKLPPQDFRAWLDKFTAYSDEIPFKRGETFSREMIYQDQG